MNDRTLVAILGVLMCAAPAAAQEPGAAADARRIEQHAAMAAPAQGGNKDVQIKAWTSRTAVWIGDQVELAIEATLAPTLDVLDEDLAKDKLKLEGVEVLSSSSESAPLEGGGTRRRFRYQLATYEVGAPTLTIGPQTIRYYVRRPGEPPETAKTAGEVQLPAIAIARRSTLPDDLPGIALRAAAAATGRPVWVRQARAIGIGLIVLAAAPLAVAIAGAVRRSRSSVKRPSARVVRSHGLAAIDELKAMDVATEAGRLEAYTRLERALRRHVAEARGIPAHALSAGEIAARLGDAPAASTTAELLTECERARYGPPDRLPPADRVRATLERAEEILGTAA